MKLKLATADFSFPLLAHDRVLDLIALLEFDGVDLGLFEGRSHLWPSREFKHPAVAGRRLRRKLAARGLRAADVFLQLAPDFVPYAINHPAAARRKHARERFLQTLAYAQACGCEHVTALPGVAFPEESPRASWARTVEELTWRVGQARHHKLTFAVEAHVGSIVSSPKAAAKLVQMIPGLTLTLDYTHFTRLGMRDAAVEPLLPYASHFHTRGARKDRLQTSFADNAIDYRRVFRKLAALGYHGWLGIEYVWINWEHCNESDNLSETILFRDFIRGLFPAK